MNMRRGIGGAVVVACVTSAAVARAEEPPRVPPWAVRLEPGVVMTTQHLRSTSVGGGPPPLYFGASLERRVAGPVRVSAESSVDLFLGWMFGATVRYAAVEQDHVTLSIGAGPLFAPAAEFGWATFGQLDTTVQFRVANNFGIVVGGAVGVALNHQREQKCGVDTCEAWLERGDLVGSFRTGVGWAF